MGIIPLPVGYEIDRVSNSAAVMIVDSIESVGSFVRPHPAPSSRVEEKTDRAPSSAKSVSKSATMSASASIVGKDYRTERACGESPRGRFRIASVTFGGLPAGPTERLRFDAHSMF
jgi:hypothetical protein